MVFGALAVILPLLLVLNVLVSISSKSFLHALLGASFTDSLLVYLSPVRMLWSIVPDRFQWTVLLIIVIGSGGLFFLTKWSLGLRLTLSRRQKRQYLEMKEHVEEVVNAKKQQLYREYLGQSVGDHDL
ncbi:hypothetical protein L798_06622 [Zootermopsis nevadensis]|uniref:Uncharacterized protein n=4 Tax=Zootermopsis nevadensis TaxID=136037 RepID=A0A067R615_ZOONE|nr:hypothetical protein L798_06622 [Zootermopsis nevadensis]